MPRFLLVRSVLATLLLVSLLAALLPVAYGATGLTVGLIQVSDADFPQVVTYLTVTDENGWPLSGLTVEHFTVVEGPTTLSPKAVTVESVANLPLTVILALDTSVDKDAFPDMQAAALQFVSTLGPEDRMGVMVFADQVKLLQNFTGDVETLKTAITNLTRGGSYTALNNTVAEATQTVAAQPAGRRAVVLITDNIDNAKAMGADEALQIAQGTGVPVFTFGFGKASGEQLAAIATQTGARSLIVNRPRDLNTQLRLLGLAMRQGYRVSFASSLQADSVSHEFSVLVKAQERSGEATGKFTARPSAVSVKGPGFDTLQPVRGRVFVFAEVDAASVVKQVEFAVDQRSVGVVKQAPYSLDLDTSVFSPGTHTLTIVATDVSGNTGTLETTFVVDVPLPLSVTMTAAPASGIEVGESVLLTAFPETSGQVTLVEFWLDGQSLGTPAAAEPYTLTLSTRAYTAGEHTAMVTVQDSLGQKAQAAVNLAFARPGWQLWLERAGLFLGWAGVALLALLAPLTALRIMRAQQARIQALALVEVANLGNVRSRFDLKFVDDDVKALKAEFLLNGEPLAARSARVPAAVEAAPAVQAAAPASPRPAPAEAKPPNRVGSALGQVVQPILDLIATLGMLLPGSLGRNFARFSSSARQVQYTASSAQHVSNQMQAVGAAASASAAAGPAPAPDTVDLAPSPRPVAASKVKAAPSAKAAAAEAAAWYQTPMLEAGETLAVHLRLVPRGRVRSQPYTFRILSRSAEIDQAQQTDERGSVPIKGVPFLQRLLPFAVFFLFLALAAAGALMMLMQTG